jgi:autotransporter-associated beta strand protein
MQPASIYRLVRTGSRAACLLAGAIAALLAPHAARALEITWDVTPGTVGLGNSTVTGGSGTWDETLGNWTTDGGATNLAWSNAGNDTAIFGGAGGTVTLGTAITVGGLTINSGGYAITGNTLTFGTAGNLTALADATLGSVLTGAVAITKDGAGKLTLTGANTFTDVFNLNSGVVNLSVAEVAGSSGPLGKSVAINPGSIVMNGGTLQHSGANAADYSGRFSLADSQAYNVDTNGQSVSWAAELASSGGTLSKSGTGTLTLKAIESFTGATTVSGGTLALDLNTAFGNNVLPTTSALTLGGGSLSVIGTGGTVPRSQTIGGTTFAAGLATLTPTLVTASTTANVLTLDLGSLTRSVGGTGNIVFTTGNTTTANTQITTATGTAGAVVTDANGVAYLTFGTSATSIRDWAVKDAGNTQILQAPAIGFYTAADATTIAGHADIGAASPIITGASGDNAVASIRFDNASARTLTLNNDGVGSSTFSVGGILVTNNVGNNATVIAGNATLQGPNLGMGDLVIHSWDTSNSTRIDASISGSGGFTKSGTGNVILSNTNTYTGPTTIGAGTLTVGNGGATGDLGGTTGTIIDNGTLTFNTTTPLVISNLISGTGGLIQSTGSVTITASNTQTGSTTVNGGTMNLNPTSGTYPAPGNILVQNNGSTLNMYGTHAANGLELKSNSIVNLYGTETISTGQLFMNQSNGGTAVLNVYGTLNLNGGDTTIANNNTGANPTLRILDGGVVNQRNGGFKLAGISNSSYSKATLTMDVGSKMTLDNIDNGNGFVVGSGGNLVNASGVATVNLNGGLLTTGRVIKNTSKCVGVFNFNGGTLKTTINSTSFLNLAGTGTRQTNSRVNVRNGGAIIDTNGYAITISEGLLHSNVGGDAATDGGLTLNDTAAVKGMLTLTGANTYTGPTVIGTSTLKIGGGGNLQGGTYANTISIAGTGVFDYNSSAAQALNGGISGEGALIQRGAGTLTLNGDNSYTGGTTISAGILVAGNSNALGLSGAITNDSTLAIGNGVTLARLVTSWGAASVLAGTGTYTPGGTFTVGGTGNCPTLSPGIGTGNIGTLTIGNDLILDGTTLPWDVTSTSSYDAIAVQGNLTLSNLTTVAAPALAGGAYNIITYTGSMLAGDATNLTAAVAPGALRGGTYSFDISTPGLVKMIVPTATTYNLTWNGDASNAWTVPSPLNWSGGDSMFYNGDTVTFDNSSTVGAVQLTRFSATIAIQPAAVIVNNDGDHPYTFSGDPISGTGTLTKSGVGMLTLNTANSYTGDTIISDGTVVLGNAAAIPTGTGVGNVVLNGGATVAGTLDLSGKAITLNGLSGTSDAVLGSVVNNNSTAATLTVGNNNATSAFAGNLTNTTGTIALVKTGTGTLTLSGGNTLLVATARNGTLAMTGGTLTTTGTTSTGHLVIGDTTTTTGNFSISDGTVNVAGSLRIGNLVNSNGNYTQSGGTVNVANEMTLSCGAIGSYSLPQSFTLTGGQFNLTATSGDKLWLSNGGGVSTMTVSGGTFSSVSTGSGYLGVRGNTTLNVSNTGVVNMAGPLSYGHTGGNAATNTINLGDGTNFSPGTSGMLAVTQLASPRTDDTATLNFNGGTLKANAASTTFLTGLNNAFIKAAGAIIDTNTFDITISQSLLTDAVSMGGGLTKTGAGTLTLAGANTFTGATRIDQGTLKVQPPPAGLSYNFNDATLQGWHNRVWDGTANGGAGGWVDLDPNVTTMPASINGGVILPAAGGTNNGLFVPGNSAVWISGNSDNHQNTLWLRSPQFQPGGSGDLTVSLAKGITHATWTAPMNESAVPFTATNGTGWMGVALRTAADGNFVLIKPKTSGNNDTWYTMTFTQAELAPYVNQSCTLELINADMGGWGWITMDNVFIPQPPSLQANAIPDVSPVNVNDLATLDLGGYNETVGSLAGAVNATVSLGTGTLTAGGNNGTTDFAGTITSDATGTTVSLVKAGTGMLTLSGVNTYTGATAVNAGTLALGAAGSITTSSGVTLAAGAVLDTSAQTSYAMPAAQPVTLHLSGAGSGSAGRLKAAVLDISTAAVALAIDSPLDDAVYVLADYTGLTGTFAGLVPPPGYTINYTYNGSTQIALVATATPYDIWAAAKGLDGSAGKDKGPNDDPDKDGRSNLAEFAFNGDPLSGSNNGQVYVLTADGDGDAVKELLLTAAVRKTASFSAGAPATSLPVDGITYAIEGGTNLSGFPIKVNLVATAVVPAGAPNLTGTDYEYRSFSLSGSNGLPAAGFLRAKVTQP